MARYAANLPLLANTDFPVISPAGVGIHAYLLIKQLCGVPPLWALQTATLNPAQALHATDSLGTVAVGKVADLVLLEGDPLEDIWNVSKIRAVVANGRYFDRAGLDRLLVEAAAEYQRANAQRDAAPP